MANQKDSGKYIAAKAEMAVRSDRIPRHLYTDLGVYRGLRDARGKGVLTGLTSVSRIDAVRNDNGKIVPSDGRLYYCRKG